MTERREDLAVRLAALPKAAPLDLVCRGAVELLGVDAAAVVLMSAHETGSVAASWGPAAARIEDLQFALGEGPCLTAYRTGLAVLNGDISDSVSQWPAFVPAAVAAGARAVFAVPLQLGAIRLGVLYLLRAQPGPLLDGGVPDVYGLARLATIALLDGNNNGAGSVHADGWAHRAVVHQAAGMVSVQLGMTLTDALARLRGSAYSTDRSIYDVALDVVARRLRFAEDDGQMGAR